MSGIMKIRAVVVGELGTNCYIVVGKSGAAVIIDPGAEPEKIIAAIDEERVKPAAIINTHGHADHISANAGLKKKYGAPIYAHPLEFAALASPVENLSLYSGTPVASPPADFSLIGSQRLEIGGITFEVIHTPGHTPGSICLADGDDIFTGDTVFRGTIGRCDLKGGNEEHMSVSIGKFLSLDGDKRLFPGHGPATTLADEKKNNPYFKIFSENVKIRGRRR